MDYLSSLLPSSEPRPGLNPLPGTVPLTFEAAICPPLIYYIALLFLPPIDGENAALITIMRNALALLAGILFFRLPLAYHVPFSVGLTYQLALVGLYGGCRVLDAFFISPNLLHHIPRRVTYQHVPRAETPAASRSSSRSRNPAKGNESYFDDMVDSATLRPKSHPVTETATTEDGWPHSWQDRASWALELELSMRGVGFTWTTADVRHTRKTWLPSVANRVHSILVHCLPVIASSLAWLRYVYTTHLHHEESPDSAAEFDALPLAMQLGTTAALGAFLMAAFSVGHSAFAILLHPLHPHPLAYFPALYTTRVWNIRSVRGFWSYGWHRLFARLFLVYGVWPGEWVERKLTGQGPDEAADLGKVVGGFLSSAFVHSFAVRTVIGGRWADARGEAVFFAENGLAVVLEELLRRAVLRARKKAARETGGSGRGGQELHRWYDGLVGRIWWTSVLLFTGRNFARGWVKAGLVREMSGL